MENLLETVKTDKLKEGFHKYLPAVLNEAVQEPKARKVISEAAVITERKTVARSGDRPNRIAESARVEDAQNETAEILNLRRLAGLEK